MKKSLIIFFCLFLSFYIIHKFEKNETSTPFKAHVWLVQEKMSRNGYVIVIQGVDNLNFWIAATTNEKLKDWEIVTVDTINGIIISNKGIEGKIIHNK